MKRLRLIVLAASASSSLLACGVAMKSNGESAAPSHNDGDAATDDAPSDAGGASGSASPGASGGRSGQSSGTTGQSGAIGTTLGSADSGGAVNSGSSGGGSATASGATGSAASGSATTGSAATGASGSAISGTTSGSASSGSASGTASSGSASGSVAPGQDAGSSTTASHVIVEPASGGFAVGSTYSLTPGSYLVAIDTPARTYLDYIQVGASGTWTLPAGGGSQMATWEGQTKVVGLRFCAFAPGDAVPAATVLAMLPETAIAAKTLDITAAPYSSPVSPADATTHIRAALDAAAAIATAQQPVDVLVPPGQYNFSTSLSVGAHVRLRGTGGVLAATTPSNGAVHLVGDGSAALFLKLVSPATVRGSTLGAGILVGINQNTAVHDTRVIGNEIVQSEGMQVVAMNETDGLWAFNYVHGGFADGYHHTYRSKYCQVVANRANGTGDDFYAFVGYAADGDPVHHCTCIANWGQTGKARGLSAVGAGYIDFENNDVSQTQAAGVYLARESSFDTFGTFSVTVHSNRVSKANLNSTHAGLLAFADDPTLTKPTMTFGQLPNIVQDLTIAGNSFTAISQGQGGTSDGYGVEIRQSCDGGTVTNNAVSSATAPGVVVNGHGFVVNGNTFSP